MGGEAVHYYDIYGGSVKKGRAIVQEFGNVGGAAAFYLSKMGAKVVGGYRPFGEVINQDGFSLEINEMFSAKEGQLSLSMT
jgi:glutamate dehydrogenase/leucine dehydrogenase